MLGSTFLLAQAHAHARARRSGGRLPRDISCSGDGIEHACVLYLHLEKTQNKHMLPETAHTDTAGEDDNRMTEAVLEVNEADFICVLAETARNRAARRIRALGIALAAYCLALMLQHGRGFLR